jgi:hypothetical protein
MRNLRLVIALFGVALLSMPWIASAQAQVQAGAWSQLYRLSSDAGRSSDGYCVADQYGYVHCFWTEVLYADQRTIIQYARFDGETWSSPNAIYVTTEPIKNVSPVVDPSGLLHIAWAEGLSGPAYYTYAPANTAASARSWAPPIKIDVPARPVILRADPSGVLHLLYINQVEEPGVFYTRSLNQGATWSAPIWLDPDILANHIPDSLSFELDDAGGLHAVWYYGALDDSRPDWVRYSQSLDGGTTWSLPFLLDRDVEEENHHLTSAGPIMTVAGQTVHVIWAAGSLNYRHHRYSTDAGRTWSASERLFGDLNGQAGDGMAIDGNGQVHYVAQIRYPQGIYHAYWDQTQWTRPSLVYLLSEAGEPLGDRVHAHDTHIVVRAGNQLVMTFGDPPAEPDRRLFAMHRLLDDVPPLTSVSTPVSTATPLPAPSPTTGQPTPMPTLTPTPPFFGGSDDQPQGTVPASELALRAAMVPTLLLLAATVVVQLALKLTKK